MLEGLFQPTHLLLIFGIALLVLGPKKLPDLGKGLGRVFEVSSQPWLQKKTSLPPRL
jgi:TatA/E family protein of Tat protein translocase